MDIRPTDALIVVDLQNDFFPGGALAVTGANVLPRIVNKLVPRFEQAAFTRDWHPFDHCSFADPPEFRDGSWPEHCLADSPGAAFHGDLHLPLEALVVDTGDDADKEGYSGFDGTDLAQRLRDKGVERIFVCGLATDFCVKATVLDGLKEGFDAILIEDACRAVDSTEGSGDQAIAEMKEAGAEVCRYRDLLE